MKDKIRRIRKIAKVQQVLASLDKSNLLRASADYKKIEAAEADLYEKSTSLRTLRYGKAREGEDDVIAAMQAHVIARQRELVSRRKDETKKVLAEQQEKYLHSRKNEAQVNLWCEQLLEEEERREDLQNQKLLDDIFAYRRQMRTS